MRRAMLLLLAGSVFAQNAPTPADLGRIEIITADARERARLEQLIAEAGRDSPEAWYEVGAILLDYSRLIAHDEPLGNKLIAASAARGFAGALDFLAQRLPRGSKESVAMYRRVVAAMHPRYSIRSMRSLYLLVRDGVLKDDAIAPVIEAAEAIVAAPAPKEATAGADWRLDACFYLARLYTGFTKPPRPKEALPLFLRAAEGSGSVAEESRHWATYHRHLEKAQSGDKDAIFLVARACDGLRLLPRREALGLSAQWYERAVAGGHAEAYVPLVKTLCEMTVGDAKPTVEKIHAVLAQAEQAGDIPTVVWHASALLNGKPKVFAPADPAAALAKSRVAADLGHVPSMTRVGRALLDGVLIGKDEPAAIAYLRRAARAGDQAAAALLRERAPVQPGVLRLDGKVGWLTPTVLARAQALQNRYDGEALWALARAIYADAQFEKVELDLLLELRAEKGPIEFETGGEPFVLTKKHDPAAHETWLLLCREPKQFNADDWKKMWTVGRAHGVIVMLARNTHQTRAFALKWLCEESQTAYRKSNAYNQYEPYKDHLKRCMESASELPLKARNDFRILLLSAQEVLDRTLGGRLDDAFYEWLRTKLK